MATRFTADLNDDDDERFDRLTRDLGDALGRLPSHRGRRYPSRADLLRAVLAVTDRTPAMRHDVHDEVRAENLRRSGPSDEITDITGELHRHAARVQGGGQDALADIASRLDDLAGSLYADVSSTAAQLEIEATAIERLAATYGGYELLRPLLTLARRLQILRDAVDPAEKVSCPRCNQRVRVVTVDDVARPERHNDQAGSPCPGLAR